MPGLAHGDAELSSGPELGGGLSARLAVLRAGLQDLALQSTALLLHRCALGAQLTLERLNARRRRPVLLLKRRDQLLLLLHEFTAM